MAELPPLDRSALVVLVALKILVHLPGLLRYGYFRDELYFLDCARHLDWGYVDHAPLVAVYAKIALLLGGSLPALRILPLLAGAATVALTVLLVRQLGGGRLAQWLGGLCVLIAPVYLMVASILSMNTFEPLSWMGCGYVLVRIIRTGESRLWLLFGALAGLGIENKHSTLLFGFAVVVALVLSPERRELLKPWIWIGGGIALLLFLPNLLWQVAHGFPTLETLENVQATGKNIVLSPLEFVGQQVLLVHPITFPIWLSGLASLLLGRLRRFRVLGWTYLVLLATMIGLAAKSYYLAPIYPMLMAAGGVAIEGAIEARLAHGRWARAAVLGLVALTGAVFAPLALPIVPPGGYVAYADALGVQPERTEVGHVGALPQLFGDQFGWPELVAEVAEIYHALPADERARTGILASNYGEAGAINLFGPALGLPPAICAHQTHFFWGPPEVEPETLVVLQWSREDLEQYCGSVERAGVHFQPWGMDEENRPIFLCRDPVMTLAEAWPRLKHWN